MIVKNLIVCYNIKDNTRKGVILMKSKKSKNKKRKRIAIIVALLMLLSILIFLGLYGNNKEQSNIQPIEDIQQELEYNDVEDSVRRYNRY